MQAGSQQVIVPAVSTRVCKTAIKHCCTGVAVQDNMIELE